MTKRFPVLGLFFSRLLGVLPGVLALATLLALAPASQADEPDAAKGPAGRRLPYYVAMDPPIVYPLVSQARLERDTGWQAHHDLCSTLRDMIQERRSCTP